MTKNKDQPSQGTTKPPGFLREVAYYLRTQKRWWLTPIFVVLALLALVAILAGVGPVLPFIYTLF